MQIKATSVLAQTCGGATTGSYNSYTCSIDPLGQASCQGTSHNINAACGWTLGQCISSVQEPDANCSQSGGSCFISDNNFASGQGCFVNNPPTPGPSAPPSGGASCGSPCSSNAQCAGLGVNPACTSNGTCYDQTACGGPGPTPVPAKQCQQSCNSSAECSIHAPGVNTSCVNGTCLNLDCFNSGGQTQPGANCYCSGSPQCGQPCGVATGINCLGGSACRFTSSTGFNQTNGNNNYCIGQTGSVQSNSLNPAYHRSPGTTYYLKTLNPGLQLLDCGGTGIMGVGCLARVDASGNAYQTQNFTPNDAVSTCSCVPPGGVPGFSGFHYSPNMGLFTGGTAPALDGATVNAAVPYFGGDAYGLNGVNKVTTGVQGYGVTIEWSINSFKDPEGGFGWADEYTMSATTYDIEIVPEGKEGACNPGGNPTDPNAICLYNTTVRYNDYTFAPPSNGGYEVRIRVFDPHCNESGPWTPWSHFNVVGMPSAGIVYLDSNSVSTFNATSNQCTAAALGTGGQGFRIVGTPGLKAEYFDAYPSNSGYPAGEFDFSDSYAGNWTFFGGTPRTRWENAIPGTLYGYGQWYHSLFGMPGTNDGPNALRLTGKITPQTSFWYYFYGHIGDPRGNPNANGRRLWINGVLMLGENWYGTNGQTQGQNLIYMNAGQIYDIKIEYYTPGYGALENYNYANSLTAPFWPEDSVGGTQPGAGSTVTMADPNKSSVNPGVATTGQFSSDMAFTGQGTLTLNPGDPSYTCSCPVGCTYSNLTGGAYGKDIYVNKTPPSWWQVIGGDVTTNGTLKSVIPAGSKLILNGAGGYPGNAIYGGLTNLTTANVSSTGWLTNTSFANKIYDSTYFNNVVPASTVFNSLGATLTQGDIDGAKPSPDGYYYYKASGNLILNSNININANKKVVIFVEGGDFNINGNINIQTKGQEFFMAIVGKDANGNKGGININPTVTAASGPALEGLFVADGTISTGSGNNPLYIRGSIASWGGLSLKRTLGNNNATNPAETVEYAPDLLALFPRSLVQDNVDWQEVIP